MGTVVRTLLRYLREISAGLDAAAAVWHGIPVPDDHPARRRTEPDRFGYSASWLCGDVDDPALRAWEKFVAHGAWR